VSGLVSARNIDHTLRGSQQSSDGLTLSRRLSRRHTGKPLDVIDWIEIETFVTLADLAESLIFMRMGDFDLHIVCPHLRKHFIVDLSLLQLRVEATSFSYPSYRPCSLCQNSDSVFVFGGVAGVPSSTIPTLFQFNYSTYIWHENTDFSLPSRREVPAMACDDDHLIIALGRMEEPFDPLLHVFSFATKENSSVSIPDENLQYIGLAEYFAILYHNYSYILPANVFMDRNYYFTNILSGVNPAVEPFTFSFSFARSPLLFLDQIYVFEESGVLFKYQIESDGLLSEIVRIFFNTSFPSLFRTTLFSPSTFISFSLDSFDPLHIWSI